MADTSATKYIYRTCPKCRDYLRIGIHGFHEPDSKVPIHARCPKCGFNLNVTIVPRKKSKK